MIEVLYNVEHELPLSVLLAIYFFMTGLSAGSFLLSTLAYGFGMKQFKPIGKVGVVLAILLLAMAPLTLIVDMTQPFRLWHLFLYLNPTSPVTWGSFLLTIYPINCLVYAFFMFKGDARLTKTFGLIGVPLAISVHGYTGFILAMGKARALWNTALMPTLFLVSAMVSGIALMILVIILKDRFLSEHKQVNKEIVFQLVNLLVVTLLLDMFLIGSDVAVLLTSDAEAREGALLLLSGGFSPYFVGLELILGSLIPLIILNNPLTRNRIPAVAVASVLVMIGIMAMRYNMVIGGQSVPLS